MVEPKKIIWSAQAQHDRLQILEFWYENNQSIAYPKKLSDLFVKNLSIASYYPNIGKKTDIKNVRALIIKDFLIFYEIYPNKMRIWDNRRNPDKLKIK